MISYNTLLVICAVAVPIVTGSYQNCPKRWIKQGCYLRINNDLVPDIDDRKIQGKIDWDNYFPYLHDLMCRCRKVALAKDYEWFAVGNYGACYTGKGKFEHYTANHLKDVEEKSCVGAYPSNKTIVNSKTGEICVGGEHSAYFYKVLKDDGIAASAPQAAEEVAAEREAKHCTHKSDVLLLVDASGSIEDKDFSRLKEFLMIFIDRYAFHKIGSRLGIIRFDTRCYLDLLWLDSSSKTTAQLKQKIIDMKLTGGSTLTDNALECGRDKIIKPFKRPGVPVTIFIMTDGNSWNGETRLPPICKELKDPKGLNCTMVSLGIGGQVSASQLAIMASSNKNIFVLSSFKELIEHAAQHLNNIIDKACV